MPFLINPDLSPEKAIIERKDGAPIDFKVAKSMIQDYREKMKAIAETLQRSGSQLDLEQKIVPSTEYLALVLDKKSLFRVLEQKGCDGLVALFAVEKDPMGTTNNTVVVMGLDDKNKLLPPGGDGKYTKAEETWTKQIRLENDAEFDRFFSTNGVGFTI